MSHDRVNITLYQLGCLTGIYFCAGAQVLHKFLSSQIISLIQGKEVVANNLLCTINCIVKIFLWGIHENLYAHTNI